MHAPTRHLRDPSSPASPPSGDGAPWGASSIELRAGEGPPRRLLCAACGHPITTTDARLSVDGQLEFERTNPGGYTHRFGCFLQAEGCVSDGVPSKQATWFKGCHWQIQVCARCRTHLGWLFFAPTSEFYALILDALR